MSNSIRKFLYQSLPLCTFKKGARGRLLTSHIVRLKIHVADFRVSLFTSDIDASRIYTNEEWTWIFNVDFDVAGVYNSVNNAFPLAVPTASQLYLFATLK